MIPFDYGATQFMLMGLYTHTIINEFCLRITFFQVVIRASFEFANDDGDSQWVADDIMPDEVHIGPDEFYVFEKEKEQQENNHTYPGNKDFSLKPVSGESFLREGMGSLEKEEK